MNHEAARRLFPVCRSHIHLNHAGVSPMSERVREAVRHVTDVMSEDGWKNDDYTAAVDGLRNSLARLVGVPAGQVSITRGTAHGISLLARGIDWRAGDNIVSARLEYPANLYPWMAARRQGAELRLVEPVDGRVTPDAVLRLVDARTRVVALSFVQFWNGYRIDLAEIGAECRRRGVILAVDGIQGLGVLPFDLTDLNADFVAGAAGKWLMGPVGIGFTAWRPELLDRIEPLLIGTGSVENRHEYFAPDFRYEASARKFEESAASWLDVAAFGAALNLLNEVGIDNIADRVLGLSERLASRLAESGQEIVGPWPRRREESSGIVSFRHPSIPAEEQLRQLVEVGVIARTHSDFIRLSPHFYNTDEEFDRVLAALAAGTPAR